MDNAPIHTAKKLNVPDNVILLFQPPYCPEVNPIERVWQYIKYHLRSEAMPLGLSLWFINLDDVKEKVANILKSLNREVVISLTNCKCFTDALSF